MCKECREQIKDPNYEGFCHCMLYYKSIGDKPKTELGKSDNNKNK